MAAHAICRESRRGIRGFDLRRLPLERFEKRHQVVRLRRSEVIAEGRHLVVAVEDNLAHVLLADPLPVTKSDLAEERAQGGPHLPLIVIDTVAAQAGFEEFLSLLRVSGCERRRPRESDQQNGKTPHSASVSRSSRSDNSGLAEGDVDASEVRPGRSACVPRMRLQAKWLP